MACDFARRLMAEQQRVLAGFNEGGNRYALAGRLLKIQALRRAHEQARSCRCWSELSLAPADHQRRADMDARAGITRPAGLNAWLAECRQADEELASRRGPKPKSGTVQSSTDRFQELLQAVAAAA